MSIRYKKVSGHWLNLKVGKMTGGWQISFDNPIAVINPRRSSLQGNGNNATDDFFDESNIHVTKDHDRATIQYATIW